MPTLQVRQSKTDTTNHIADFLSREGLLSGYTKTTMFCQCWSGLPKKQGELLLVPTETLLSTFAVMHYPLDVHVAITLALLDPFLESCLFFLRKQQSTELICLLTIHPMTNPVSEMG